ncbi:MAG TPA: hypothetical protein LFW10_02485 [Rickettsia endosymbiont of Diachasma alloeum]|nr:hypothetical protein [Rickettsia endosymbiont of Diachasma alloeum]
MTEQDYKTMISSDSHARHAAAYSSQNKPWEQLGMTEQDDLSTLFRTVVHAHCCISSYFTGDR